MTMGRVVLNGVLAGIVATSVKSRAEGALQPLAEKVLPPAAAAEARPGADPSDHPDAMPPTVVVDRVAEATGADVDDDARTQGAAALHWTMGVGAGLVYALVARRWPRARAAGGAAAGLALYGATHAGVLPALGLQAPVHELPRAALLWEPGSHVAYGIALDSTLRALA